MDVDEFWLFLERSARESDSPQERTGWLEDKLGHVSRTHIVDFQAHLDAARRPIDTYATWGAAYQIMDGTVQRRRLLVLPALADRAGPGLVRACRP